MRVVAALISFACTAACSFPEYNVQTEPVEVVPSCDDGQRNGDETGRDCGMAACGVACPAGQGCEGDADCEGGKCKGSVCQAASCGDGLENGAETDLDCGGDEGCDRCTVGQRCQAVSDCDGGLCASGQCRAPTCKDGLANGSETDIDCGGDTCNPCKVDQACQVTTDCDELACAKGKCQPADCSDGVWNQDETDLDCGGACGATCADEARCGVAGDCQSGVCPKQTLHCAAPSCEDGVLNGAEPTIDCGESCPQQCAVLDTCSVAADCESGTCVGELCAPSAPTDEVLSTSGWVATASHTFNGSNPQNAIDGLAGTDWITGATQVPDMWFAIDMQKTQIFYSIAIDSLSGSGLDAATAIDVWLSNDGTFTTKAIKNVAGSPQILIEFQEPQAARYLKVSLSPGIVSDRWWRIDELRVRQ